jgi:hypothetical protein
MGVLADARKHLYQECQDKLCQRFACRVYQEGFRNGREQGKDSHENPDGVHTHGHSGGSGLGTAVLVVIGAALAVKLAGPVLDATAELLRVLLIAAGVIVGVGGASLVGLIAWRWRSRKAAARAMPPRTLVARAAQPPLLQARRAGELPAASQREPPGGLHLHFHGLDAAQVAAIIACQQEGDVNPGG